MLAKGALSSSPSIWPSVCQSLKAVADSAALLARENRTNGSGRYSVAIAIPFLWIFWLLWTGPSVRFFGHQTYLVLIGIATTAILGAGPGVLAVIGLAVAGFAMIDVELDSAGTADTGAVLCTLLLANAIAVKSTFWRIRAERQAAQTSRLAEQLKLLTDGTMQYALYMTDPCGRIMHWNDGAERFTGWREQDVIGRHMAQLFERQPEMVDHVRRGLALAEEHGGCEFDSEVILPDGQLMLQNSVITALYDDQGAIQGFANLVRDVTADREREVRLQEREAELSSILEAAPEAVFGIDDKGRIDYVNGSACRAFGYDAKQLQGQEFSTMLAANQPARKRTQLMLDSAEVAVAPRKLIGRRGDGSNFPIEMTFVKVERAGRVHSTAFIRDLTEHEATKARLELLQAEMLHGTRYSAMGAMASMLAHELNQPLTAVAAYMEGGAILLKREKRDSPKLERAFRAAAAEAVRAGDIMRRLRSFVSSGEAQLEVHDVDEVIESSVALIRATAAAAAVSLRIKVDDDAGPVFADPIQIQQVIGNLCRNAIDAMRDSPQRILTVRVERADELTTHILIGDTGPGIPPAIRDRIFDAFVSQKVNGTGVGLSICRTIVEAHGGQIWVDTSPEGTCFGFSLKRKKGA